MNKEHQPCLVWLGHSNINYVQRIHWETPLAKILFQQGLSKNNVQTFFPYKNHIDYLYILIFEGFAFI